MQNIHIAEVFEDAILFCMILSLLKLEKPSWQLHNSLA